MAYNEKLTNRLRKALAHIPKTEEKRMFRGVAFMVNEKLCISVGDDEIMCRVDPLLHDRLIIKDGCRSVVMKGREYKGYVYVNERVIPRKRDLDLWIKLALEFNKVAKSSKKNKKK
jgi:TfoX/Sxy family transcriptional regulator of competence genes